MLSLAQTGEADTSNRSPAIRSLAHSKKANEHAIIGEKVLMALEALFRKVKAFAEGGEKNSNVTQLPVVLGKGEIQQVLLE